MKLESKIEAIMFFKNEAISIEELCKILKMPKDEIEKSINNLKNDFENRGIVLVRKDEEVMLGTHPELSNLIEEIQKEELNKDLSKASLETLSIILYKNGATRREIDYIRGVNSGFTLRILSIRGLIEKTVDKEDARSIIYKPSFELMSYLGIKNLNELPKYDELLLKLNQNIKNANENET